ncbi:MAG: hypothetical protein M0C28_00030 [Candidatus Moduliflexus flocculans]|nr:hypothetical protein [Candidatus Moduliflexus flocculans]
MGKINVSHRHPERARPAGGHGTASLVRTHSESGYQILKGIDLPWPLADIVYQHHERALDGRLRLPPWPEERWKSCWTPRSWPWPTSWRPSPGTARTAPPWAWTPPWPRSSALPG